MTRKFIENELVFASHNKGKMKEVGEMFAGKGIKVYSTADFNLESPEETEDNFLGNALIKAKYTAEKTGKPALADDSGFCVEAIDGEPGVYSANWAETENGRDFDMAMNMVIDKMGESDNKNASFVTCLVLYWPDGHYEHVEGRVSGSIVWPPRGDAGFGYDPMFVPEGHTRTFAEMGSDEKNGISHRGRAFEMLMEKCFKK